MTDPIRTIEKVLIVLIGRFFPAWRWVDLKMTLRAMIAPGDAEKPGKVTTFDDINLSYNKYQKLSCIATADSDRRRAQAAGSHLKT